MSQLALQGGAPVLGAPLLWWDFWPPVEDTTEQRLVELYRSRRWTAFDEGERHFADAFAELHGARHGVFMMNGTVTLQCALGAYGIGPGDEVIVPALTWQATAMAAQYVGATPVFVDVEPDTLCLDPEQVRAALTNRTKAIIPVHLYGSMVDMDRLMILARANELRVIEDCAHAHGGIWAGQGIGSIGDVGSFSFQQTKTMACAEGGICITSDPAAAERMFRMKHIGYGPDQLQGQADDGPPEGLTCYPFRATGFQREILVEQLAGLPARLERYGQATAYLERRLSEVTRIRFQARGRRADRQGYYGWVMLFDDPAYADISIDLIQKAVAAEGVPLLPTWGPVYGHALYNAPISSYRLPNPCPVTEHTGRRALWLMHAYLGLDDAHLAKIAEAIEKVLWHADDLRALAKAV